MLGLTPTIGAVKSKAALRVHLISTSAMSMATLCPSHALLRAQQSPVAISIYSNSQELHVTIKSTALSASTPLRISRMDPLRLFLKLAQGLPILILMITRLTLATSRAIWFLVVSGRLAKHPQGNYLKEEIQWTYRSGMVNHGQGKYIAPHR